jgi:nitroreductase
MEFEAVLRHRRSTRTFLDEPVPDDRLEAVLLAGANAPIGSNLFHDIHLTVLTDKSVMTALCEAESRRMLDKVFKRKVGGEIDPGKMPSKRKPFYGAPVVIIVSHRRQDLQPGIEFANCAVVVHTMHLAATNLGLGSVYVWGILESMREIPELDRTGLLELPENFAPLMGLMLGLPKVPLKDKAPTPDKIPINYI